MTFSALIQLTHRQGERSQYPIKVINKCKKEDNYLFDIVVGRFTQLLRILSIIKDVVMDLESYAKMGSKIKKLFLGFNIEAINYTETSAAQGYHRSCFIIGFGYIRVEIVV